MASRQITWRQIYWPTPLDPHSVTALLRAWAGDDLISAVVLEVRSSADGVRWLVGTPVEQMSRVLDAARALVPGLAVSPARSQVGRADVQTVRRIALSTRHRPLRDGPEGVARALFGALDRVNADEEIVVQVVLGPHHRALTVPTSTPSSAVRPWWQNVVTGQGKLDSDQRQALKAKHQTHGFGCTLRIGVTAADVARRKSLVLSVFAALRSAEEPGAHLRLVKDLPHRLSDGRAPVIWPLALNIIELTSLIGAPIGEDLPGLPKPHPKLVAPILPAGRGDRIVGAGTAPGAGQLGYGLNDAMHGTWITGPTGVGKSTLLSSWITADISAGRGVVVIDPKDLVADVLARIPAERRDDVVVLGVDGDSAVGINPLAPDGRSPELIADNLLALFHRLYADAWGPRTSDVLHHGLLALARAHDSTLVMLPVLLTNPGFRRRLLARPGVLDPFSAQFWAQFEAMSDAERAQVVAPSLNKLRQWVTRPTLRAILGQVSPRLHLRRALNENKIIFVSLPKGTVGAEASQLLAALVLSEVWGAVRERVAIPAAKRTPVMVYLDEAAEFLHLPTDLSEVIATSRGYRCGWTIATQFATQFTPSLLAGVKANLRSRVAFQLPAADAKIMCEAQSVLKPEDFTSLGPYEVYASLQRDGHVTPWASGRTLPPLPETSDPADIRARSRARYGRPVADIEAELLTLIDGGTDTTPTPTARVRRASS